MIETARRRSTSPVDDRVVTKERLFGTELRWRRFGEPTPAGGSVTDDGTPDYGVFGPGSVAWEIILHPLTMVLQFTAQQQLQLAYRPIAAGIRDRDPISRKAQNGTLTIFDVFERGQRNSGIHAPMWLGDTETARRIAKHLHNIHSKVAGDVIDTGAPELGGYAANSPRDALWAALTEMHSMLWLYEAFAFRDGHLVGRLPQHKRDQFMAEVAQYCKLFAVDDDEVPTSMAEIAALYDKYDVMFRPSATMGILPGSGASFGQLIKQGIKKNFHRSQLRVLLPFSLLNVAFGLPVTGALSGKARRAMGVSPAKDFRARLSTKLALPFAWLIQQPWSERYFMRLMWGPDAIKLIASARRLQRTAK